MAGFAVQGLTQAVAKPPTSLGFTPNTAAQNPLALPPVPHAPPAPPNNPYPPPRTQDPNTGNVGQWNPGTSVYDPVSAGAAADQRALELERQRGLLKAQQFSSLTASMPGLLPGTPAGVAPIPPPNTAGADAAAFGRAKETTAASTKGLLTALQDRFAGRGLTGSSLEANAETNALASGASDLSNVATTQAVNDVGRTDATNTTNYQGGIAQRGQDLAAQAQRSQAMATLWKLLDY